MKRKAIARVKPVTHQSRTLWSRNPTILEVGRHQYRHVRTDKVFPTRCLLPLGSRWNIMAAENIAHRLIREPVTQVGHGADDPVIAPEIFLRHLHHQPLGFLVNSGTTPGFAKLRSVEFVGDIPRLGKQFLL